MEDFIKKVRIIRIILDIILWFTIAFVALGMVVPRLLSQPSTNDFVLGLLIIVAFIIAIVLKIRKVTKKFF